jgi:hypothetical protein
MDDRQLAQLLVFRFDYHCYGDGGMLLSPDSQRLCTPRQAAELEGIDPDQSWEEATAA